MQCQANTGKKTEVNKTYFNSVRTVIFLVLADINLECLFCSDRAVPSMLSDWIPVSHLINMQLWRCTSAGSALSCDTLCYHQYLVCALITSKNLPLSWSTCVWSDNTDATCLYLIRLWLLDLPSTSFSTYNSLNVVLPPHNSRLNINGAICAMTFYFSEPRPLFQFTKSVISETFRQRLVLPLDDKLIPLPPPFNSLVQKVFVHDSRDVQ